LENEIEVFWHVFGRAWTVTVALGAVA